MELDENLCEGLVPVRELADDFYDFDEKNYCLVGRRNNVRYRLGDKVKVKVVRANLERKQLDFVLIDDRTRREGEDDMGKTGSVAQILNTKKGNIKPERQDSKRKTRSHKK